MTVYLSVVAATFVLMLWAQRIDWCVCDPYTGNIRHSQNAHRLFLVWAVILICIAGLRYYVGTDYGGYYHGAFTTWANNPWQHLWELDEPIIYFINSFLHIFTDDGAVSIFVLAGITLTLLLRTVYKNSTQLYMAGLLFLFMGGWDAGFNGVRQALAAAILLCGYPFLRDKKFWKYLLVVALAFLCHKSAAIMILPYFVAHNKITFRNVLLLIVGTIVVLLSYDRLFGAINWLMGKDYDQSNEYIASAINIFRILVSIAPAAFFLGAYSFSNRTPQQDFWINLLIIHAVAMTVASQSAMLGRIGLYTSPFCIIAIPELCKTLVKRSRSFIQTGILILYFCYFLYGIWGEPFNFIWQR